MEDLSDKDTLRRLSETVLHASERRRQKLFLRLTAKNAERIAVLMRERPLFFNNDPHAPTVFLLADGIKNALPAVFFKHPTEWIESQNNIFRPEKKGDRAAHTIGELWEKYYDASRVKEFTLPSAQGDVHVVSKRLSRRGVGTEEVAIHQQALEAGIPTVKILGQVIDHGNTYLWLEKWPGINLLAFFEWFEERDQKIEGLFSRILEMRTQGQASADLIQEGFVESEATEIQALVKKRLNLEEQRSVLRSLLRRVEGQRRRDIYGEHISDALSEHQTTGVGEDLQKLINSAWGVSSEKDLYTLPREKFRQGLRHALGLVVAPLSMIDATIRNMCSEKLFPHSISINIQELETWINDIRGMCYDRGVRHMEIEPRNILIGWDMERNEPLLNKEGKPELRVIDWEPI